MASEVASHPKASSHITTEWKTTLRTIGIVAQFVLILMLFIGPIMWMIWASFQPDASIVSSPPHLSLPTIVNYVTVFVQYPFFQYGLNSMIIAGGATVLGLALGVPAAYAAARYRIMWPAFLTLLARMAPGILFLIPWYILASKWGLTNNFLTLIVVHTVITMPVIMWLMVSFFEDIPDEVVESAMIDGCTDYQTLIRVGLPLVLPGIAVSTILAFIFTWNYFLFALVLGGYNTTPLTVAAFNFIGQSSVDWGALMAAAVIISLPPMVLTALVQRWLIRGLTFGSVKG